MDSDSNTTSTDDASADDEADDADQHRVDAAVGEEANDAA